MSAILSLLTPRRKAAPPNYREGTLAHKLKNHKLTGDTHWPFGHITKVGIGDKPPNCKTTFGKKDFTMGHMEQIKAQVNIRNEGGTPTSMVTLESCNILVETPHGEVMYEELGREVQTRRFDTNDLGELCTYNQKIGKKSAPLLAIDHPDKDVNYHKLYDYVHSMVGHNMHVDNFAKHTQKQCNHNWERWGKGWWDYNMKHAWNASSPAKELTMARLLQAVPATATKPSKTVQFDTDTERSAKTASMHPVTPAASTNKDVAGILPAASFDSSDGELHTPPGCDSGSFWKAQAKSNKKLAKSESKRAIFLQQEMGEIVESNKGLVESTKGLVESNKTLANATDKQVDEQKLQNQRHHEERQDDKKKREGALEAKHRMELQLAKEREAQLKKEAKEREAQLKKEAEEREAQLKKEAEELKAKLAAKERKEAEKLQEELATVQYTSKYNGAGAEPLVDTTKENASYADAIVGTSHGTTKKTRVGASHASTKTAPNLLHASQVPQQAPKQQAIGATPTFPHDWNLGKESTFNGERVTVTALDDGNKTVQITFVDSGKTKNNVSILVLGFPVGENVTDGRNVFVVTKQTPKMVYADNGFGDRRFYPQNLSLENTD